MVFTIQWQCRHVPDIHLNLENSRLLLRCLSLGGSSKASHLSIVVAIGISKHSVILQGCISPNECKGQTRHCDLLRSHMGCDRRVVVASGWPLKQQYTTALQDRVLCPDQSTWCCPSFWCWISLIYFCQLCIRWHQSDGDCLLVVLVPLPTCQQWFSCDGACSRQQLPAMAVVP